MVVTEQWVTLTCITSALSCRCPGASPAGIRGAVATPVVVVASVSAGVTATSTPPAFAVSSLAAISCPPSRLSERTGRPPAQRPGRIFAGNLPTSIRAGPIWTLPPPMRFHVRYWIADPPAWPHVVPGFRAIQWYWGSKYDIGTANPDF